MAQPVIITAEQVQEWITVGKKALLIDVRTPDEYRTAHIPGAVNVPADQVAAERSRLPKDKNAPVIFYCRGAG